MGAAIGATARGTTVIIGVGDPVTCAANVLLMCC